MKIFVKRVLQDNFLKRLSLLDLLDGLQDIAAPHKDDIGSQGSQALGIGTDGRASTIDNLLSASNAFGLPKDTALAYIDYLSEGMAGWESLFLQYGVCDADISMLRLVISPIEKRNLLT